MLIRRSLDIVALKPVFSGRWMVLSLAFICYLTAWCDSSIAQVTDYSAQRQAAQEKYENSLRRCYQKFAVSDCKQDATVALNAELSALKKIESAQLQRVRAENALEKMQSLATKAPSSLKDPIDSAPPKEQAQRKKFEEKQLRVQQHREAVEQRWLDKKSVKVADNPSTP